jgi:hypothetical protein
MTRLGSLVLCATLFTGLFACGSSGSSTPSAVDLAPVDNTVSGWMVDRASNKNADGSPMTANSAREAESLIDGAAAPFYKAPFAPKQFLWQNYINDTLPAAPDGGFVLLYILEMPSADQASGLYTALLKESEYYGKQGTPDDWKPTSPLLGADSRIEDTNTAWWINFHKDAFYVEVMLSPSYGPPPDYTIGDPDLKQEAFRFAETIASKI